MYILKFELVIFGLFGLRKVNDHLQMILVAIFTSTHVCVI